MTTEVQIAAYIAGQPAATREELQRLHDLMLRASPDCRLWFLDGRNEDGKVVSNPNIGYGRQMMVAGGKTREFYKLGLSANTTGISLYVMGIADKKYLPETYGKRLGKASVTGYCIKFKTIDDIDWDVLEEVIRFGFSTQS